MKKIIILFISCYSLFSFAKGKSVDYQNDGKEFQGHYTPASGKAKGLIYIIHDWDGLTDYEIKRSEMLAEKGYDVFAMDLYGKGHRPQKLEAKKEATSKLYKNRKLMRKLMLAGMAAGQKLSTLPAVVIGYCFGGTAVLELARSKLVQVKGYASFHGGLKTPPKQTYNSSSPIFIAHGGADKAVSLRELASLGEELEKAGTPYEIEIYSGAPHAFSVFGSERYHKKADTKSWRSFLSFIENNLTS